MLEAIMGFEGGGGPFWEGWGDPNSKVEWSIYDHIPPDDPFATQSIGARIAKAMEAKFDDILWKAEELKPEEVPEELKDQGQLQFLSRM